MIGIPSEHVSEEHAEIRVQTLLDSMLACSTVFPLSIDVCHRAAKNLDRTLFREDRPDNLLG